MIPGQLVLQRIGGKIMPIKMPCEILTGQLLNVVG
jgi:hypothetical protein